MYRLDELLRAFLHHGVLSAVLSVHCDRRSNGGDCCANCRLNDLPTVSINSLSDSSPEDCERPCLALVGHFSFVELRIHSKDPCKLAPVPPLFSPSFGSLLHYCIPDPGVSSDCKTLDEISVFILHICHECCWGRGNSELKRFEMFDHSQISIPFCSQMSKTVCPRSCCGLLG